MNTSLYIFIDKVKKRAIDDSYSNEIPEKVWEPILFAWLLKKDIINLGTYKEERLRLIQSYVKIALDQTTKYIEANGNNIKKLVSLRFFLLEILDIFDN